MPSKITLHGWLPNGVAVTIDIEQHLDSTPSNYQIALETSNQWLAAGMLAAPPTNEGTERELIVTVMRREKSDGTPILDFYPKWGAGTAEPYGTYKFVHKYINSDAEVDAFLNASGFRSLEDIPLYDGQAPLKRNIGRQHAKETRVPTPFYAVRKQGKEKLDSEGKPYHPWELFGYEIASQGGAKTAPESRQTGANSSAGDTQGQTDADWTQNDQIIGKFYNAMMEVFGLSTDQVVQALRHFSSEPITAVHQYEGTKDQAKAACMAFKCGYKSDVVREQFGDVFPETAQLAIEMIELHQIPF
jgi:hypothetical protein